jgi:hypothetical protein
VAAARQPVGALRRDPVPLHRPVDDRPALERHQIHGVHLPAELVQVRGSGHALVLEDLPVPHLVEIGRVSIQIDRPPVTAAIAVVRHVQRLVQVPHEVDQEPQRLGPVERRRRGIGQHPPVARDRRDDAAAWGQSRAES